MPEKQSDKLTEKQVEPYTQYLPPVWVKEGLTAGDIEYLDTNHCIQRLFENGSLFAVIENHRTAVNELWCGGYVAFRDVHVFKASGHKLVTESPLEISPSLACRSCPSHGYIKAGKWVSV